MLNVGFLRFQPVSAIKKPKIPFGSFYKKSGRRSRFLHLLFCHLVEDNFSGLRIGVRNLKLLKTEGQNG